MREITCYRKFWYFPRKFWLFSSIFKKKVFVRTKFRGDDNRDFLGLVAGTSSLLLTTHFAQSQEKAWLYIIRTETISPSGFVLYSREEKPHRTFWFLKRCLWLAHWIGIHVNYCRNRRCALQRLCTKNSKWNCAASFLGIHKSNLLCSVVCELFVV